MSEDNPSRRTVLKSLGATGVGALGSTSLGIAGAKSARFDPEEAYERALRAREEAQQDGLQAFRDVLRDTPQFEITTTDVSRPTPPPVGSEESGPSPEPQFVYPQDVDMSVTLTSSWTDYIHADCSFSVEYDYNDGDRPYDPCALGWEEREFDFDEGTQYSSDYVSYGHYNTHGVKFDYYDEPDDCHCQKDRYFGARIRREVGGNRKVIGSLWHTWGETTVTSAGISTAGIVTVNLANETEKWDHPVQASAID